MGLDSAKSKAAEARVPETLRPVYRELVQQYTFATEVRYGRGYVAYEVLADLILVGWRPSASATKEQP